MILELHYTGFRQDRTRELPLYIYTNQLEFQNHTPHIIPVKILDRNFKSSLC